MLRPKLAGEEPLLNRISIIVPAYAEGEALASTLRRTIDVLNAARINFEIILIVDTAPGNNTGEVARRIASESPQVRVFIRKGRRGVGTAVQAGISLASGDIVMLLMGDGAESPSDVVTLARRAQEGYDIVVGNRFMNDGRIAGYPALKYCANRLCNALVRLLFKIPTSDVTNAFKAYSHKAATGLDLRSKGYSIFLELPVKAYLGSGRRLTEIPVGHAPTRKKDGLRIGRDGVSYCVTLLSIVLHYGQRKRV